MARFAVLKQSRGIKKCAFCKYYYDPSYTVISPKKGQKNVWEYENNIKRPCRLRNNMEMQSHMCCSKFESRI